MIKLNDQKTMDGLFKYILAVGTKEVRDQLVKERVQVHRLEESSEEWYGIFVNGRFINAAERTYKEAEQYAEMLRHTLART